MSSTRSRKRAGLALAATLPLAAGVLAMGIPSAQADASHGRHNLAGGKPAWATAKADKGATADSAEVTLRVYLAGRDAQGLAAYAQAVSDPGSVSYGKFLSPKRAKARFGASARQVAQTR